MVLLVALFLVAAAAGLIYIGPAYAEAYILVLLAILGTVGVFALFAMASGIMRLTSREQGNPLLKAVVDNAFDGIVVTDQAGRVFYANATYLDLIGASDGSDVRPIERVFIGDPDVLGLIGTAREPLGSKLICARQEVQRFDDAPAVFDGSRQQDVDILGAA